MLIQTTGKPNHISLKTAKDAARFYGEYLLGQKLYPKVFVTLNFQKFKRGSNDYAYCDWIDESDRKRDFMITLDARLNKKETLLALAHEMVHVKQYAKGEMRDIFRPTRMVNFQGVRYMHEEMDYWEQPWEIEAYGREKGLYVKIMTFMDEKVHGYISV